jgi:NDP-sugar pyrophosphorylase family protein
MPIGDLPILEIVLRQLRAAGFDRVQIATGHLSELVRVFCGDGSKWSMQIGYSHETEPLGTAGPIALMADRLDENFLVMNGDLLTTLHYQRAFAHHLGTGAAATVCVFRRDAQIDFGVIEVDAAGNLEKYTEKPTFDFTVSMGINFFHRRVLEYLRPGERIDIPELIQNLMARGERVACYREECRWLDIGRADDYLAATETFAQFKGEFLPPDG